MAITRDAWLEKIIDRARPMFAEAGKPLPEIIRAAMCPPHRRMKAIGLCWAPTHSRDGAREIWVSSEVDDPIEVAATLVHECAHAALPPKVSHGKPFKALVTQLHLAGPAKSTHPNDEFKALWSPILAKIGPMPGAKFLAAYPIGRGPQNTTPHKNVTCPNCGFFAKVRVNQMSMGRLTCPVDLNQELLLREEME